MHHLTITLYEQNITLRRGALDNFAFLMRDINTDPVPTTPLDTIPTGNFDQALRATLHDPTYHLK